MDYREDIMGFVSRRAKAGEDWETSLFAGTSTVTRDAALSLADWLDTEADGEWGPDERHHLIAQHIRDLVRRT